VEHVGRGRCRILLDAMHFFRAGARVEDLEALHPDLIGYAQLCDAPLLPTRGTYMREAMFERMVPGTGELPLRDWIAALPADVEIGLEVPRIDDLQGGVRPRDHAARCVVAARELGA
jgi:sugar phosphate isomerase/epimerase